MLSLVALPSAAHCSTDAATDNCSFFIANDNTIESSHCSSTCSSCFAPCTLLPIHKFQTHACRHSSSSQPTNGLVQCPGSQKAIGVELKTDKYPSETSWSLTNTCTGALVASKSGGYYTSTNKLYPTENFCVDDAAYAFRISDVYSDGICCGFGNGNYEISYNGELVASGGEFTSDESKSFGTCPQTVNPTLLPTMPPTPQPTPQPTQSSCGLITKKRKCKSPCRWEGACVAA